MEQGVTDHVKQLVVTLCKYPRAASVVCAKQSSGERSQRINQNNAQCDCCKSLGTSAHVRCCLTIQRRRPRGAAIGTVMRCRPLLRRMAGLASAHLGRLCLIQTSREGRKIYRNISAVRLSLRFLRPLPLLALLVQLHCLPVNRCDLLRGETQTLWNLRATETTMCEPSIVEHSFTAWAVVTHNASTGPTLLLGCVACKPPCTPDADQHVRWSGGRDGQSTRLPDWPPHGFIQSDPSHESDLSQSICDVGAIQSLWTVDNVIEWLRI